jgi:endoglucanase
MSILTIDILRQLSETPGGPGDEDAIRDLIARAIRPHVDDLSIDNMGNLIAIKRGAGASGRKVVAAAHMDEVAFMITKIDSDGFLHVARSGGVNPRVVLGKRVQVGPEHIPGVIALRPPHLADGREEITQTPKIRDLAIDIGAKDDKEAKSKVKLGQYVVFQTPFRLLGMTEEPSGDAPLPPSGRISGKAFDDRLGCAALMELLAGDPFPFDFYGVFTVQEEIGLRGAQVAGGWIEPDAAFILEGTICPDLPGPPDQTPTPSTTRLGRGPAITPMDRSYIVPPRLLQHLLRAAQARHIPYQFKHPNVGGTDAAGFTRHRGIPAAIISTPARYIHGPVAIADLSDFWNGVALARAALADLPDFFSSQPQS